MRLWDRMKAPQLELLDASPPPDPSPGPAEASTGSDRPTIESLGTEPRPQGEALLVPLETLFEDPANPRTEFPETELGELADDIRRHGILQPIVVHPADASGRFRIHFGAKRFRAAARAGLSQVPVTIRSAAADPYAQVAENQKRHGLSPLDLARFIRSRVDLGETNAAIAGRLGIDLTTVAHHLALLELPPPLETALKSGRCVSPRTLMSCARCTRSAQTPSPNCCRATSRSRVSPQPRCFGHCGAGVLPGRLPRRIQGFRRRRTPPARSPRVPSCCAPSWRPPARGCAAQASTKCRPTDWRCCANA